MKKLLLLLFSVFTVLPAMAESVKVYTLDTSLEASKGKNSGYAASGDVTVSDIVWNATGNMTTAPWRLGGKSIDKVDREVYTKTAMTGNIKKVVLTLGTSTITLNSAKMLYSSAADFSDAVTVDIADAEASYASELVVDAPSGSYYKFVFNVSNSTSSNKYVEFSKVEFYTEVEGEVIDAPTFSSPTGSYAGTQTVSLSAAEGCKIYYTLDGTDPDDKSTEYTAPISITETTTVKAIAYKGDSKSLVATATYTIIPSFATMADVLDGATTTEIEAEINVTGWVCSATKTNNSYTYFVDGLGNGVLSYVSNSGFAVGDKLSGSAIVKLVRYNGYAEIKGLTATSEGVTIAEKNVAVAAAESMITDLALRQQGIIVTVKGLSYNGVSFKDENADSILVSNSYMELPAFKQSDKVTYDLTGVLIFVKKNGNMVPQVAPQSAEGVVEHTSLEIPTSQWSAASETVDLGATATATFTTNSDSKVTYISSNPEVATVSEAGVITGVAKGTAVITASTDETSVYTSSFAKITITVINSAEISFVVADFQGQGTSGSGSEVTATKNGVVLTINKGYCAGSSDHVKVYGTSSTSPTTITIDAPAGKHVAGVEIIATGNDYIRTWQVGTTTVSVDGKVASWTGQESHLVINMTASSQARITGIDVLLGDGEYTSIAPVAASAAKAEIFNILGQRVESMDRAGIYIVNGRKVYVK